ncbi:hypothetical protein [Marinomonas sp. 2405UD68-3]|uniref:hypothetical protein n=1 Tax=Marinomonas sp. 2405UD68-3 TaxID=3391835 RepID=UPI0039C91929
MLIEDKYKQWRLDAFEMPATIEGVMDQALNIQEKAQKLNDSELSFTQQMEAYKELDLLFDALESLFYLMKITCSCDGVHGLQCVLDKTASVLIEDAKPFLTRLLSASLSDVPTWAQQLKNDSDDFNETGSDCISAAAFVPAPVSSHICAEKDSSALTTENRILVDRIKYRILSDPLEKNGFPRLFNQRANPKKAFISLIQEMNTDNVFEESRAYFDSMIPPSLRAESKMVSSEKSLSLSMLRAIQRQAWSHLTFSIEDAIDYIDSQFSLYDERFRGKVKRAFSEGRIRFISNQDEPSFCFDTPKGSFIQVYFVGDLESLALLTHECGHLLHQETVRNQFVLKQDIQPYLSEAIALYFENRLIKTLLNAEYVYLSWRNAQKNEWFDRHVLLVKFELALYQLDRIDCASIAKSWMQCNREFYPPYVMFDNEFAFKGEKIAHLCHAPFYTLVYPAAYELSQTIDETLLKKLIGQTSV